MKKTAKCLKQAELPPTDEPWQITAHHLLGEREVLLVLDECYEILVDAQTFYMESWQDGDLISRDELQRLLEARLVRWGQDKLLNYLSYRPRSEAEVRRYLTNLQLSDNVINQLISRLKELGLIDDAKFVELWIQSRMGTNPIGPKRLVAELLQKGIDKSLILQKLDELAGQVDEEKLAIELAAKRVRRYQRLDDRQRAQKLMQFLLRRGFSYDVVRTAVRMVIGEKGNISVAEECLDSQWQRE